jgi:hypothetical protein
MERLKNFLAANPSAVPLTLVVLIFVGLLFFLGLQITSKPVRLFGRAANAGLVDPKTSTIWATQYTIKVGSSVNVSVFLHNSEDRAISGKSAKLTLSPMEIADYSGEVTTDSSGQATFTVTAKAPGRLTITAVGDGVTFSKNLTLELTNQ